MNDDGLIGAPWWAELADAPPEAPMRNLNATEWRIVSRLVADLTDHDRAMLAALLALPAPARLASVEE